MASSSVPRLLVFEAFYEMSFNQARSVMNFENIDVRLNGSVSQSRSNETRQGEIYHHKLSYSTD
jgi:hypothetical protein